MTSWVLLVELASGAQPGVVQRVSGIFADRGLSLSDVLATVRQGNSFVVLGFASSQRLCDYLVRRLSRMEDVRRITVHHSDDRPPWEHLPPV